MGIEVAGILGLIGLILIVYAIVKTVQSDASTLGKVIWVGRAAGLPLRRLHRLAAVRAEGLTRCFDA